MGKDTDETNVLEGVAGDEPRGFDVVLVKELEDTAGADGARKETCLSGGWLGQSVYYNNHETHLAGMMERECTSADVARAVLALVAS